MLILLAAQEGEWDELHAAVRQFQNTTMSLRYAAKPVVVAPFQMTLGGGCEMVLHANRNVADAETYIGLVEVGVGLIPGGGGTKEMAVRAWDAVADNPEADHFSYLRKYFELVAMAKVSTSAVEARHLGILKPHDRIVMNRDRVIEEAKQTVLTMVREGYVPPKPREDITGARRTGADEVQARCSYDAARRVHFRSRCAGGTKIAEVMSGGRLTRRHQVSEQYLLDLEREAFVSLCGTRATQERLAHMLKTGKPLRN